MVESQPTSLTVPVPNMVRVIRFGIYVPLEVTNHPPEPACKGEVPDEGSYFVPKHGLLL